MRIKAGLITVVLVLTVIVSTYFEAVAAVQLPNPIGPPLILYHQSSGGQITPAATNIFAAGQEIWVAVPKGVSPSYTLTVTSLSGLTVFSRQNSTFPALGLIPISLAPTLFPPGTSFRISLQDMVFYSPGFSSPQTSMSSFSVVPTFASIELKSSSFQNNTVQAQIGLQDFNNNPLTGVRLGLFLIQGNSSLLVTTEKTDLLGRSTFQAGESLAGGTYQFQVRALDSDAVFATPAQLPSLAVGYIPTVLAAWTPVSGSVKSRLLRADTGASVNGRLLVLEQRLADGNWTVTSQAYTDNSGQTLFHTNTTKTSRVSFNSDDFYSSSRSLVSNATQPTILSSASGMVPAASLSQSSDGLLPDASPPSSTFVGNTFSNGHITMKIEPSAVTIYDPQGQAVIGQTSWEAQVMNRGSWQHLSWDGPLSMSIDDLAGNHVVALQGTAGSGQVAVSMRFLARSQDALYTPLQMPIEIQALRGTQTYRLVWHLTANSAASFQLEQRTGDLQTPVRGPLTTGASVDQSPSGENSLVALASDGTSVLIGLNWNEALRYYQGTRLKVASGGATADVQFGTFTLSSGQSFILPACPCPDGGGGGGGGGTVGTTTTTILPSSAYATVPAILSARVQDLNGNPVAGGYVWWVDNSSKVLGNANTNSTGYATMVWTAGAVASQSINANFAGNSVYANSYGSIKTLNVQKTPTTIEMLQPQQIAYSWDLYNYYRICCNSYGLPIVVPVNILTLAASNNTSPANIYMPAFSGASSVPSHVSGYGWAGFNLTSAVTITMNGTYTQTQNMNWTRNFYLPPCPNPPNCSTTPRTGHMYLTASLAPPSTLYSSSSTTLNIPFQEVNSVSTSTSQVLQSATPPAHLYVNVNASYPYLSVTMQGLPVSLAMYNAYLAYTLGAPTSSFLSSGYTFYALTGSTDFAHVCTDSTCSTPAANVAVYLYDYNSVGSLVYCGIYSPTNNRGIAYIAGNGSNCGYPYAYAAIYTSGNTLTLPELFHIEAVSNPSPFLTNFQGYNYAVYAPQKTGRYLLDMRTFFLNSAYAVLYPTASYSDVQYPYNSCCDIFLNVQKHPLQAQTSFNPATTTILSKTNATIQLEDLATSKPLSNSSLNYILTRNTPNPGTIMSGSLSTNVNGTAILPLGLLSYGNYTLSVSTSATSTLNALASNFGFTVYQAVPTLILRDISALASATPGMVKFLNPSGNSTISSPVLEQSAPYEFYAIIGTSTDLLTLPPGQTAQCLGNYLHPDKNCVYAVIDYGSSPSCASNGCLSGHQGLVIRLYWTNGQPTLDIPCTSSFSNCSTSVTRLTGTNNICGTTFCTKFSIFVGSINAVPRWWLYFNVGVVDSLGNSDGASSWGYVDYPDGAFLVNGIRTNHSDASTPLSSRVSFQFDATSSPNSITSVTMNIFNQTTSTNTSICLIGGSGCLQSAQTTSNTFLLYAPNTINFKPGSYLVTMIMTCPSCAQTTLQVLSLVLVVSQSSWSENAIALNPYTYETSLINNATSSQLAVSGLTENIYINGIFYTTLQTDSNGNGLFTWTPQVAGQYTIKSVFPGQNYYTNSSITVMISVARRNVVLAANNSPQSPSVNQPVTWNIYAQDMASNSPIPSLPISLFINGVNTTTVNTSSTGYAAFNPPAFSPKGSYNITFVSAITSVYNPATIYDPLMVYLDTKLTLQAGTITLGQQNTFTISLKDANGATLSARVVQVKIDGAFYQNVTTDTNSQAQFSWRPDNTGIHSVSVDFSATGSSDFAYRPSSAGLTVNVVTQTTINTISTSITQSVNLGTAQGTTQPSIPSPSISITFPDPFTITVNIQYNGKAAQASSHLTNSFGLNCSWWGCLPYWNVNIDASVAGMFSLNINGPGIGIATGGSESIFSSPPTDDQAFDAGATVSGAIALTAIATLASSDIASISTVLAGIPIAVGAGAIAFRNSVASYRSYLLGLLLPPLMAIPCLFAACHEPADIPLFFLLTAAYTWLTWEEVMFRVLWTAGGFVAALVLGIVIVTGSLLVTLL